MKHLLLLLPIVFLFACKPEIHTEEIQNTKDIINKTKIDNERIVRKIEKECADNGNKTSDLQYFISAKKLIRQRDSLFSTPTFLTGYLHHLEAIYATNKLTDQERLTRAKTLINQHTDQPDSLLYFNCYSNLLLIEQSILNEYLIPVSGGYCGFEPQAITYKKSDTIKLGEVYDLAVIAPLSNDAEFKILDNGDKPHFYYDHSPINVPYETEVIGGLVMIKIKPVQPGDYHISGQIRAGSLNYKNEGSVNFRYNDHFYVKIKHNKPIT